MIYVQTKKISSYNQEGKPIIETSLLKLNEGRPFDGFIKFINSNRYSEIPRVMNVIQLKGLKKTGYEYTVLSDEVKTYQEIINNTKNSKAEKSIDYKKLSEEQAKLIESFELRLKSLESKGNTGDRQILESKANELNIQFRNTIGDAKLLEKINEIDQEFKL